MLSGSLRISSLATPLFPLRTLVPSLSQALLLLPVRTPEDVFDEKLDIDFGLAGSGTVTPAGATIIDIEQNGKVLTSASVSGSTVTVTYV